MLFIKKMYYLFYFVIYFGWLAIKASFFNGAFSFFNGAFSFFIFKLKFINATILARKLFLIFYIIS